MNSTHAARGAAASMLLAAALAATGPAHADEAAEPASPAASVAAPAGGAAGAAPAAASEPMPAWTLATLPDEVVPFQGLPNRDAAGTSGTILYPAPGLIGFVAAVATHALIQSGIDSHNKSEAQLEADKVLDPYRDVLAGFHLPELQQRALAQAIAGASAHLRATGEAPPTDWLVLAAPAFAMTPDASALVLDDVVSVHAANVSTPAFEQTVRIVTPARGGDLSAQWHARGGEALKETAVAMMAEALDIALEQARHPVDDPALPFRTVRYVQGGVAKTERAQLISETCTRMVVRTLRGSLMSVPHRLDATLPAGCPAPASVPPIVTPAVPAAPADATPSKEAAAQPAGAASSAS